MLARSSHAQLDWKEIGQFPDHIALVRFYDERLGFVSIASTDRVSQPELFRTMDGGATWSVVNVDHLKSGFGIMDMIIVDSLNGWACGGCDDGYSVWHTTDGGADWQTVGPANNRYSVSMKRTSAGIVLSDFNGGVVRLTSDDGATFRDVLKPTSEDNLLGIDFSDTDHGVDIASFRSNNTWYTTSDGGLTWSPTTEHMESWAVYGQPGTTNFFAAPEGFSNFSPSPSWCYRSTDFGNTWSTIYHFPVQSTGDMAGVGDNLYMQSENAPGPAGGIYRSSDEGASWMWLGGPNGYGDTRFCLLATSCHRTALFAARTDHTVWKAIDTVGGNAIAEDLPGYTPSQAFANIHPNDTAIVELNVQFSASSDIVGVVPDTVTLAVDFDANVLAIDRFSDVQAPAGWNITSLQLLAKQIDITLVDTGHRSISSLQNFGSIAFTGLPTTGGASSLVWLDNMTVHTDCRMYHIDGNIEGNNFRTIRVQIPSAVPPVDNQDDALAVYPNPSVGILYIHYPPLADQPASISVSDLSGRKLTERRVLPTGLQYYMLPCTGLPNGTYILQIETSRDASVLFSIVR